MIGKMIGKTMGLRLFDHPSDMEPLLPEDRDGKLAQLGLEVTRHSERLRDVLHPVTRRGVVDLVRSMNSYYSNLIEGHRTMPHEIDMALRREFSGNAKQRELQQLHWAHVEAQRWMESGMSGLTGAEICGEKFLRDIHREFYTRVPVGLRRVKDSKGRSFSVEPGELRLVTVSVGIHAAPAHAHLGRFLRRFSDFYGPLVQPTPQGLVAAAAAHHRLAWIHPFLDGNGRVTRLFTQAWLQRADAASDGLWTLARGFARHQQDYKSMLARADERRLNDFDGRGYLSERRLSEFCEFTLNTALDQLRFMRELLDLDGMQQRIIGYAERRESAGELPTGAGLVLREIFLRGEIARGEVSRIIGISARTAQTVTRILATERLVASDSVKGRIRLGFPARAAAYYFPNLFPAGAE